MQRFLLETGITAETMAEEMRKVHLADRPFAKIDEKELEPSAIFYINALERQQII